MSGVVCFRMDLSYTPWNEEIESSGEGEPSYVVRLVELAREQPIKFHFFATADSVNTFPSLSDIVVGEGHSLDPFIDSDELVSSPTENQLKFELNKVETAFKRNDLSWQGIAIDRVELKPPLQMLLKGHYQWAAMRSYPEGAQLEIASGFTLIESNGLSDSQYFIRDLTSEPPTVDGFLAQAKRSFDLADEALVINLRPGVLAKFDPKCVILRGLIKLAHEYHRTVTTFRLA